MPKGRSASMISALRGPAARCRRGAANAWSAVLVVGARARREATALYRRVRPGPDPEAVTAPSGDIAHLQSVWDEQARADPLWAVLSDPARLGRRWDLQEFMATGEGYVDALLARFDDLGGRLPAHALAIDFGSGVGRLTQPLAVHFERVIGVDISPTMVEVARRLNRHGERVSYLLNGRSDLASIADRSADLVHSSVVLQHIPPELAEGYIREFLRVTKPGGGLIVQVPSHLSDQYVPSDADDQPLPASACRAMLVAGDLPTQLAPDERVAIAVEVTNTSGDSWTQGVSHAINVGNHWRDAATGEPVRLDDGRARLPGRMSPGERACVDLLVTAPSSPGTYLLQLDVVQEGVTWFGDAGGAVLEAEVRVVETHAAAPPVTTNGDEATEWLGDADGLLAPAFFKAPAFEMHGVPRARVEQILAEAGVRILAVDEWVNEWHSYTYYVQCAGQLAGSTP